MAEWWGSLAAIQQVFYYIAVPFTVILVIQAIMTLIGLGSGGDTDADSDADTDFGFDSDTDSIELGEDIVTDANSSESGTMAGFRFFSVRGIVAFFCIFGWTGAALYNTGMQPVFVILLSAAAGFFAMFVIGLIFYSLKNLQSSGNIKYSNAIGKTASVYIPIPAQRSGKGKVMVTVQNRLIEAEAITNEKKKIPTGETVKITGTVGTTLIVTSIKG